MNYQYSYLLLDLGYLIIWCALFFWKKHCRREMILISLPFGVLGLALNYLYVRDWWMPLTITGTIPALEDFLYGFLLGGIAAVIGESFHESNLRHSLLEKKKRTRRLHFFWYATVATILLFYGAYFILGLNTFIISLVLTFVVISCIYYHRPDLIRHSLIAGLLLVLANMLAYSFVTLITPGWIEAFWYFDFFPPIIIGNVPLEDVLFFFCFGAAVGPLYAFWQEGRLRKR